MSLYIMDVICIWFKSSSSVCAFQNVFHLKHLHFVPLKLCLLENSELFILATSTIKRRNFVNFLQLHKIYFHCFMFIIEHCSYNNTDQFLQLKTVYFSNSKNTFVSIILIPSVEDMWVNPPTALKFLTYRYSLPDVGFFYFHTIVRILYRRQINTWHMLRMPLTCSAHFYGDILNVRLIKCHLCHLSGLSSSVPPQKQVDATPFRFVLSTYFTFVSKEFC